MLYNSFASYSYIYFAFYGAQLFLSSAVHNSSTLYATLLCIYSVLALLETTTKYFEMFLLVCILLLFLRC